MTESDPLQDPNAWEHPDTVERFARRDPDHRLVKLVQEYDAPGSTRVLDVGCAAGRNTEPLARWGFDVFALDTSRAMVERTRGRVAEVLGADEAQRRVRVGRMDELGAFEDGSVHLLLALGIFQEAESYEEWTRTLSEAVRVLAPGGRLLIANFSPRSQPRGKSLEPVPGEPFVYQWPDGRGATLLEPEDLDAEMALHGLEAEVPTQAVEAQRERGWRVTVNGLYRKGLRGVP
jgi:SAM-dependent methyltransferase